jgi:glycosyltransferase involved in cell wall biosynthesis
MKVAFFLLHFPVFSETFVSKEILNLQLLDVEGLIVCEKRNYKPPFHPHINDIKFPIIEISQKIFSKIFFRTIKAHFYWLTKNPIGYLKSIKIFFSFFSYHHLRVFIKSPLLAKKLINQKLSLIYVHEADSPCLYALICAQLLNIPTGIIIHTQYLFYQNKYLSKKILYANFIIFQSRYSLLQCKKITRLSKKYFSKCYVLSTPGVDTSFFLPSKVQTFPKQIKILSIGRLEEAKGFPILLKAINILKSQFPDIRLTIIGDGSQKNQLEKYIFKNKLENNIKLLGFIGHEPKLIKIIHQHQYFILPSITDSQKVHDVHPNVIKEAMSCGLIVVTSNLGGITEIINNKKNAFLINKITPQNLVKIIRSIESLSTSQKNEISQKARQAIMKSHQQKEICYKLKNIFLKYSCEN